MRSEAIDRAIVEESNGEDAVLGTQTRIGLGFMLSVAKPSGLGTATRSFGHSRRRRLRGYRRPGGGNRVRLRYEPVQVGGGRRGPLLQTAQRRVRLALAPVAPPISIPRIPYLSSRRQRAVPLTIPCDLVTVRPGLNARGDLLWVAVRNAAPATVAGLAAASRKVKEERSRMKHWFLTPIGLLLACTILGAGLLMACGGADEPEAAPTSAPQTEPTAAPPQPQLLRPRSPRRRPPPYRQPRPRP